MNSEYRMVDHQAEATHWHNALLLVLRQLGIVEIMIMPETMKDLLKEKNDPICVMMDERSDGIYLRIGKASEARDYFSKLTEPSEKTN